MPSPHFDRQASRGRRFARTRPGGWECHRYQSEETTNARISPCPDRRRSGCGRHSPADFRGRRRAESQAAKPEPGAAEAARRRCACRHDRRAATHLRSGERRSEERQDGQEQGHHLLVQRRLARRRRQGAGVPARLVHLSHRRHARLRARSAAGPGRPRSRSDLHRPRPRRPRGQRRLHLQAYRGDDLRCRGALRRDAGRRRPAVRPGQHGEVRLDHADRRGPRRRAAPARHLAARLVHHRLQAPALGSCPRCAADDQSDQSGSRPADKQPVPGLAAADARTRARRESVAVGPSP